MPRCAATLLLVSLLPAGLVSAPRTVGAQGTGLQTDWDGYRRGRAAYERGREAEARGDGGEARAAFGEAAALLRQAAARLPGRGDVQLLLGEALLGQGQAAAAYVQLSAALRGGQAGDAIELRWLLARALQGMRQTRRALGEAQAVAAVVPGHPEVHGFIGERAAELGEDAVAMAALQRHLQRRSDPSRQRLLGTLEGRAACLERATGLQRQGQLAPALAEARRCVTIPPPTPVAHALRAALALQAGGLDEAIGSARAALGSGAVPSAEAAREVLAQALLQRGLAALPPAGAAAAALADLREAHGLRPPGLALATGHAYGLALLSAGQAEAAVALLRPLAEAGEAEPALLLACARALREAGRAPFALPFIERARAATAGRPGAEALAAAAVDEGALALLQLGRPGEATRLLGSAPAGDPERRPRLLALSSLAAGRQAALGPTPRTALAPLQAALRLRARLDPVERAEAELLLASARLRCGQEEEALRRLQALPGEVGAPALGRLLPPGGLDALTASAALLAGQLQLGAQHAARALPLLPAEDARRLQGQLGAAHLARAVAAYQRGDYDRAQTLLRAVSPQGAGRVAGVIAYDLGVVLLARGRREEALQQWARLDARLVPEKWIGLGTAQEATGDRRGALEHYRRYLQAGGPLGERVRAWVEAMERFERPGGAAPEPGAVQGRDGSGPRRPTPGQTSKGAP